MPLYSQLHQILQSISTKSRCPPVPKKCLQSFTVSTAISSPSSSPRPDTSYANLSTITYSEVCTSHITKLLSQDTCSGNYTPAFNKPQSSLAMLSFMASSLSWVWFKWHLHFCTNSLLPYVLHSAATLQWNAAHPNHLSLWMTHHEATFNLSHKQFSYKLLVIMMFKWSDYSLLKNLEVTGTVWGWKHKTMSLKFHLNIIFCLGPCLPSDLFSSGFLSASKQIWDRC